MSELLCAICSKFMSSEKHLHSLICGLNDFNLSKDYPAYQSPYNTNGMLKLTTAEMAIQACVQVQAKLHEPPTCCMRNCLPNDCVSNGGSGHAQFFFFFLFFFFFFFSAYVCFLMSGEFSV